MHTHTNTKLNSSLKSFVKVTLEVHPIVNSPSNCGLKKCCRGGTNLKREVRDFYHYLHMKKCIFFLLHLYSYSYKNDQVFQEAVRNSAARNRVKEFSQSLFQKNVLA